MPHTLTLNMEHYVADITSNFQSLYCREDIARKIDEINRAADYNRSQLPRLGRELLSMLKCCDCENAKAVCDSIMNAYRDNIFGAMVYQRIPETILSQKDMLHRAFAELIAIHRHYPTPELYMRRLVNRLETDEQLRPGETGSVRLSILKHFLRDTDYAFLPAYKAIRDANQAEHDAAAPARLTRAFRRSFALEHADDSIFTAFGFPPEEPTADDDDDAAAPSGDNAPELFTLAHNLATGKFSTQGGTKRQLYLFAMAYSMTAHLGAAEERDENTDITKNLFEDYYNNNLLRNLAARHHTGGIETMPSGAGINFKNFIEVTYIYCINRTDLDAASKIELADKIIRECTGRHTAPTGGTDGDSVFFRTEASAIIGELLGQTFASEADCVRAVADRLCVCFDTGANNINIRSQQLRAFNQYNDLIASIRREVGSDDISHIIIKKDEELGYFYEGEVFMETLCSADEITDEEYGQLEFAFTKFLEILSDPGLFSVLDPAKLSRFRLIAVFYYYFKYVLNAGGGYTPLPEVFDIFVSELDPILEACGYQRLGAKNLFDMFVIFHAYLNADTTENLRKLYR